MQCGIRLPSLRPRCVSPNLGSWRPVSSLGGASQPSQSALFHFPIRKLLDEESSDSGATTSLRSLILDCVMRHPLSPCIGAIQLNSIQPSAHSLLSTSPHNHVRTVSVEMKCSGNQSINSPSHCKRKRDKSAS